MSKQFSFLSSVRFWKLFLVALAQFLVAQKVIPADVGNLVTLWLGGSVVVATADKLGQNIGGQTTTPTA